MGSVRLPMALALPILLGCVAPLRADVFPIILKGKVTMDDGSPPPFTAGIERVCSDLMGSAPGPTTNKKGEYLWRMDFDPLAVRACVLRATRQGYISTSIDISNLDTTKTETDLPPLVLSVKGADPSAIDLSDENVPGKAHAAFNTAMKALDKSNYPEAATQLKAAVDSSPKFAQGWHALGGVDQVLGKYPEARDAFQHAIETDPKMLKAYVMLARVCVQLNDWQGVVTAADELMKADKKQTYPEIFLHLAVARYGMKDLDGAKTSIDEAIRLDPAHKRPREEYVLGRILEAKGDINGAREHMSKFVELAPTAPDIDQVKTHLSNLGKPEASVVDPQLEIL